MARTFSKDLSNYAGWPAGTICGLLSGAAAVSVSVWLRYTTLDAAPNNNRVLWAILDGTSSGVALTVNAGGTVRVGGRSTASDSFQTRDSAAAFSAGAWAHVGGILDFAAGTITPYVGGAASGSGAAAFSSAAYTVGTPAPWDGLAAQLTTAGTPSVASEANQWAGEIAHLALWRAALSATDFARLARGVRPDRLRTSAVPVGYWPLSAQYPGAKIGPAATVTGSLPIVGDPVAVERSILSPEALLLV